MEALDRVKQVLSKELINALIAEMGEERKAELEAAYEKVKPAYEQKLRVSIQNLTISNGDYARFGYNCDCGPFQNYMAGYNRIVDTLSSVYE